MNKIRKSVFETNSSSCHSLVIEKGDYGTIPNHGTIILKGGQFGWEVKKYTNPIDKANYVATQLYLLREEWMPREISEQSWVNDRTRWARENCEKIFNNVIEVIKEQTHCEIVVFKFPKELYSNDIYIDHQSFEDIEHAEYLLNKEDVRNFIFGKQSFVQTDNDNRDY